MRKLQRQDKSEKFDGPVPDANATLDDDVASPTSFGGVVSAVSGIDLLLCTLLNLST
jgi:hypothetical protein